MTGREIAASLARAAACAAIAFVAGEVLDVDTAKALLAQAEQRARVNLAKRRAAWRGDRTDPPPIDPTTHDAR